jgi:hypothetical protein
MMSFRWFALSLTLVGLVASQEPAKAFRPPAVPLVTHDPYFSVWSFSDRLTDDWSRHWTGRIHALCGLARIDGKPYRWAGPYPANVPAMKQVSLEVRPTATIYGFEAGGVRLDVTFRSPLLPDELELVSRPVTYVTFDARSLDGEAREVSIYVDATAEWAVNDAAQPVVWGRLEATGQELLRIGTKEQPVLAKKGDDLRIDWGHLVLGFPQGMTSATRIGSDRDCRDGFLASGKLPAKDDERMPRPANDAWPVLAGVFDLGVIGKDAISRRFLIAYDDEWSIEHMGKKLRAWWKRDGKSTRELMEKAAEDYQPLSSRCDRFDAGLVEDLKKVGGDAYARIGTLAFRQTLAAHKLVADPQGRPLHFSKENYSNGCIATVDVTYPSAPFFLLFNPKLLQAQLRPVLDYAKSPRWKFPFAPHDLGTYPKANGQVYGGAETSEKDQMPVEECGNMLILMAALARAEGGAEFSREYADLLALWAGYLKAKGLDPENQLCTDDFAGHLARNTNLSLKAIVALGAWAQLSAQLDRLDDATTLRRVSRDMAGEWMKMADDGDHYRLAFDRPGTWSQKYNLVWDGWLGLELFPREVAAKEIAFYLKKQNRYGLPLDNRSTYTKLDWILWTATLAERRADFDALIQPVDRFLNESPSRVPMTDWYHTDSGKMQGFQARSVVGGVFLPMLARPDLRDKWKSTSRR